MSGVGAGVTDADTVGVGNAVGTVTSAAALLVGVVPMAAGAPPVAVQAASTALHNREIKSSNRFFITFPQHTVIKCSLSFGLGELDRVFFGKEVVILRRFAILLRWKAD